VCETRREFYVMENQIRPDSINAMKMPMMK
jgi:hypothetical protein